MFGAEPGAEQGRDRQRLEDLRLGQRGRHALGALRAGQIDAARHERAHGREGPRALAPVAKRRRRHRTHAEAAAQQTGPVDVHEAIGLGIGQRPEHQRVDQREDRRVRADAERQGEDGRGGVGRAAAERPQGVGEVAAEQIEGRKSPLVAVLFLHLIDAAEAPARREPRGRRIHAVSDEALRLHLEVEPHLLVQDAIEPVLPKQPLNPPRQRSCPAHRRAPVPFTPPAEGRARSPRTSDPSSAPRLEDASARRASARRSARAGCSR